MQRALDSLLAFLDGVASKSGDDKCGQCAHKSRLHLDYRPADATSCGAKDFIYHACAFVVLAFVALWCAFWMRKYRF